MRRRGVIHDANRGAETIGHTIRMTLRTIFYTTIGSLLFSVFLTLVIFWRMYPSNFSWLKTYAETYIKSAAAGAILHSPVGNKSPKWLIFEDPEGNRWSPTDLEPRLAPLVHQDLWWTLETVRWLWVSFATLILLRCFLKGRRLAGDKIERGKMLVTAREIRRLVPSLLEPEFPTTLGGVMCFLLWLFPSHTITGLSRPEFFQLLRKEKSG